jgi:hypothetical protein
MAPPRAAPRLCAGAEPWRGLWAHLKGVELRDLGCFNILDLWAELRAAVKRVRRKPRLIEGFFHGARLYLLTTGLVTATPLSLMLA